MENLLFNTFNKDNIVLKNRIVMAPMTRGRANNPELLAVPIMAEYYRKRAGAGLIITEGCWISKDAIGYINVPGIYNDEQVAAWKPIVDAVHLSGGKIFIQIAHIGA